MVVSKCFYANVKIAQINDAVQYVCDLNTIATKMQTKRNTGILQGAFIENTKLLHLNFTIVKF